MAQRLSGLHTITQEGVARQGIGGKAILLLLSLSLDHRRGGAYFVPLHAEYRSPGGNGVGPTTGLK